MQLTEGETLLILVKRDGRSAEEIADDMGIDKSYLPKLYKMDKLPRKPMDRALAIFKDAARHFAEAGDKTSFVEEPRAVYRTTAGSDAPNLERIQKEMAELQEVVARLQRAWENLNDKNDKLTETVYNLSKRG